MSTDPPRELASASTGLCEAEVVIRRARFGFNDLPQPTRQGFWNTLIGVAREPMFALLALAAVLYLVIGDLAEGAMLTVFAFLSLGLVVFQERRSERALDALRELGAPRARVVRDGRARTLMARELVPGDVVLIGEGERVPADAVLREAHGMAVDESLLSGESVAVDKRGEKAASNGASQERIASPARDLEALSPLLHAGTLVVRGDGVAEVLATAADTQLGRIGGSLAGMEVVTTPLEQQVRRLVRAFSVAALGSCVCLALWYGVQRQEWLQGLLAAIALGMSMLPEEFPMVLTVFLALGAWRMSRIKVLVRRPFAIEALGATTVLCVDKTGTLTENRMVLRRLLTPGPGLRIEMLEMTMEAGAPMSHTARHLLAVARSAIRAGSMDSMDQAIETASFASTQVAVSTSTVSTGDRPLRHYPLSSDLLAMSNLWASPEGQYWLATKGAPEAVARMCHLDDLAMQELLAHVEHLADEGLRVIAVAASDASAVVPDRQADGAFKLLGLLCFEDPLRASVPAAIGEALAAGMAVTMITGDHASTALAIARQAGIEVGAGALSGEALAALDDVGLREAVRRIRVFARVRPDQKLRIVHAMRANGEVVAMTGDGVNDAPALKAAHVGIAMSVRGTDVAREAAGIVLLDDDFGRIVGGVRLGRRIHDNLRRAITYIIAIHIPIAGLALLPLLAGLPPLMWPVHVVLIEMVIDPMCSLVFEAAPEAHDIMRRPPSKRTSTLTSRWLLVRGAIQGTLLLAVTLAIYAISLGQGTTLEGARTLALVSLLTGNLLLVAQDAVLGNGWRAMTDAGFRVYWIVATTVILVLCMLLGHPESRRLLHMALPSWAALGASLCAVVVAAGVSSAISRRVAQT